MKQQSRNTVDQLTTPQSKAPALHSKSRIGKKVPKTDPLHGAKVQVSRPSDEVRTSTITPQTVIVDDIEKESL